MKFQFMRISLHVKMNFQWVFLSREAQQYGADKCVHLDHLFRKYLRKQILYFCFKVVAATDTFLTVLNRYKEIRI